MPSTECILCSIKSSGAINQFVIDHKGSWDHAQWLAFRDRIRQQYGHIDDGQLGQELENTKSEVMPGTSVQGDLIVKKIKDFTLEQWSSIFGIAGVLVGIISVGLVITELQQHNKITKSQNAQKLVELTMDANMELIKSPELSLLFSKGNKQFDSLDDQEKPRFKRIWIIYMNVLETAFNQYEDGLMSYEDFSAWDIDISRSKDVISKFWPIESEHYSPRFRAHVDKIIGVEKSTK
jgi:hypothetical protein